MVRSISTILKKYLILVFAFCAVLIGAAQNKLEVKFGVLEQDGFTSIGKFHITATDRYCKLEMYDKNLERPVRNNYHLIGINEVIYNSDSSIVTYKGNGKYVFSKDSLSNYVCDVFDNTGKLKKKYSKETFFEVNLPDFNPKLDDYCLFLQNANKGFLCVGENLLRFEVNGISNENLIMNSSSGEVRNLVGASVVTLAEEGEVILSIHIEENMKLVYQKTYKILPINTYSVQPDSSSAQNKCAFIIENKAQNLMRNSVNFLEVEYAEYYRKTCVVKIEGAENLGFEDGFLKVKTGSNKKVKISFLDMETGQRLYVSDWLVE